MSTKRTTAKAPASDEKKQARKPARKKMFDKRTVARYWHVTAQQWPVFVLSVLSTVGFVFFLSYGNPYIVSLIVDRVAAEPVAADAVFDVFGPYVIAFIVVNTLGQACSKLQDYTVWKLQIKASYELATTSFDVLSNQSMMFHSNRYGGSLVSQTNKFINGYTTLIEVLIYSVLPIASSIIFTIGLLASSVPSYSLILVALVIVYVTVVYRMYKRMMPLNQQAASAQNTLSGELSDSVTNILTVKTYGREKFERGVFNKANRDVLKADSARMRGSIIRGVVAAAILVVIMMILVVFVVGGNAWFGISAGTIVVMFTYTYSMSMQLNRINLMFIQVNRGFGDAYEMTCILDEPTLVDDVPDAEDLAVSEGTIDFEHIDFWYADADARNKVFDNFNLHIPAGQHVGLVGRSGSGKTTLTTLLLRLSNIQEGRVLIDGQDISRVRQESLRQHIAYVPQEPMLFHRTIRENIAYGRPDATAAEIRAAAEKAYAVEFIDKLPQGMETYVGERGVKLSGGQRQRVAIARAILADKPILVLDEATSALDSESEKLIQDALVNLMEGRTSIVVAHRLSTVASLDRIVVLDEGDIVEDGTHDQLLEEDGEYAHLWERQSGGFIDSGDAQENISD